MDENFNAINILNIVKTRLFEPRKKIIYDSNGNKILTETNTSSDDKNLNNEDIEYIQNAEGWNVADKSYVDYKVGEMMQRINNLPSAPPIISSNVSNSTEYQYPIFTKGENKNDKVFFFSPGFILEKGNCIKKIHLISDAHLEDEMTLHMYNVLQNKNYLISKIKGDDKIYSADVSYKYENDSVIYFVLKCLKPSNNSFVLQLILSM